ncbi:MAG TPA: valine--tRNA ligase [Lentisphaeria bacterium]|nr:MAG: valine--tRNA ligase [Lentisphaerae bacterium GWF2_38_69]HBM15010.1 valine--tRNA ligase [Lentisphaeria bacterium]
MSSKLIPKAYEPADVEAKWYSTWIDKNYFKGIVDKSKNPYSIVIPPPNVTGILTLGHVLNNTLQDILIRWRKMQGYSVCWFPGTDHAGIATESRVEKMLREKEGRSRREIGREEFIGKVWDWKKQYGGTIIEQLKKLGCSCDWERERFTLDEGLNEAVKKVFVELYNKGYIYKGVRMINWCPVSRTALSDEEVIYKEVNGAFYHFKYPLNDRSGYLEIATTRPETMLGDTAVAVNPNDERYKHLIGKTIDLPLTGRKIPIIADELADPNFGTGCVKITPAHDPNDFIVGKKHNLEILNVMNDDATMNDKAGSEFAGMDRFDCRKKVLEKMKELELLVKIENHKHNVGYSERGDVPVEPRVSEQWFVNMKELAKPAIEAVRSKDIKFYPDRWSKVYFNWMENIQDWCISRQIWWGHRIPAWTNEETGELHVSMDAPAKPGKWKQDEDVLDTWFSSWLWPFSIMGWPDKTPEQDYFYPTNDLVTGPDIIFFWVARMIMAGYEFKGELPFRNVYFTSIIRDAQGRKLSKSLGNSPDPLDVIATYGADALRFSIIYIAPVGMDIRYSNEKCELGRNFANKIWNACRFRQMHGETTSSFNNLENIELSQLNGDDKWILSRLNNVISIVNDSLDKFTFHSATHELYNFVWSDFCDWYIESSKSRIYSSGTEKEVALSVLDYVLFNILKLLHPFMPFITEELAHFMGFMKEEETIMFASYPAVNSAAKISEAISDKAIIALVESKFELIKAGRNMRAMYNLQPAKKLSFNLKTENKEVSSFIVSQEQVLKAMLNAENIEIDSNTAFEGPAPSAILSFGTLYLVLKDAVDIPAEIVKLNKQKKELEGWIIGSKAKLSNSKFVEGAPKEVVENAREHLAELETKLVSVCEMLKIFHG